jgi:translation initiation factor IF-2
LDESLGPVATILVNTGTLKIGDEFLIAQDPGRVKTMINDEGVKLKQADPATPVRISGLSIVPSAGDILQSFKSKKILKARLDELRDLTLEHNKGSGLGVSEIMDQLKQGKMKFLKVVLKADTDGSLEAVKQAIDKIKHEEVGVKVIHAAVGSVTETDVVMAAASQGVVFGFNVRLSPRVKRIAEHEGVEVRNFKIIFELTDMLKKILEGLLEPEYEEVVTGEAEVKQIFWTKGKTRIIGCKVNKGYLENGEKLKVLRADEEIGQGKIAVLQHFEKKVPKIEENQECGIQLEGLKEEIQEGDILHGVKEEKKIKTL